jgi:hypothetical protein
LDEFEDSWEFDSLSILNILSPQVSSNFSKNIALSAEHDLGQET